MTTSIMLSVSDIVAADGHRYRAELQTSSLVEMYLETSLGIKGSPKTGGVLTFKKAQQA